MSASERLQQMVLQRLLERGRATRTELAAASGCRPATLLEAVDVLKQRGLIIEPERAGKRTGRRSPVMTINPAAAAFVGLEVAGHAVYAALCDLAGNVLRRETWPLKRPPKPADLATWARRAVTRFGDAGPPVVGIALADPGMVDRERQVSLRAVLLPGWEKVASGRALRDATGLASTLVAPESGARAYLEYHHRRGNGPADLFHLRLDRGVGAGWVRRGELYAGDRHGAMEIGHWVVAPDGPLCRCGNRGCLEAVAGQEGLRLRVREMNAGGVRTVLDAETFVIDDLPKAVAAGDRAAQRLAVEVAENVAPVFAVVAALLDPTWMVVSGALSRLGPLLAEAIGRTLRERCLPDVGAAMRLEFSELDDYAGAVGAARLLTDRYLTRREWETNPPPAALRQRRTIKAKTTSRA